jgi:hypothetical protein
MTPSHSPTPANSLLPRWRLLPRADQERVVELIEDDREDEAMEVLGMNSVTPRRSNQSPDALRALGITPEES